MRLVIRLRWAFVWLVASMFAANCGGSDSGSPSPSPTPTPTPGGTTITIANNAVSPSTLTVARGSQVTFVNNDTRPHNMVSDPHPEHTDCPELNSVGVLRPGERRSSDNLVIARTCGFHDHDLDQIATLKGRIIIQ